jgi:hypothetical protein
MDATDAVIEVLRSAGEPLHWTVVLDRVLRQGLIDPFTTTDVRERVQAALHAGVRAGRFVKTGKGVFAIAEPVGDPGSG